MKTDASFRREMIKRHALGSSIYEEGDTLLPFNHTIDDVKIQKVYEIKCL